MIPPHEITRRPAQTLGDAFVATQPLRVLLAEDNTDMLNMLEAALQRDGCHVTSVSDGGGLLAALEQRSAYQCLPELIISDVRMPGLSGLQVLEHLRETDQMTPVILITAFGDSTIHVRAAELGAIVLDKPFLLDELRAATREYRRNR